MTKQPRLAPLLLASLLLAGACGGGTISAEIAMPGPGGITQTPDTITMTPGIVVDAGDDTSVCERIRVSVYTTATAPSDPSTAPATAPIATGRGLGRYEPDRYRCTVAIVGLPARDDYWLILDYPTRSADGKAYYTTGKPTLTQPTLRTGFYPVKVVDKQTTQLSGSLGAAFAPLPGA